MTNLPVPTQYPGYGQVLKGDVKIALQGVEPGDYRTIDLLPRYNAWAKSQKKQTVTARVLGRAIQRDLSPASWVERGNVKIWRLTAEKLS